MVKKLALVEIDDLKRNMAPATNIPQASLNNTLLPMEVKVLHELDQEMKNVINDTTATLDEKVRKYGELLSHFVNLNQKYQLKITPPSEPLPDIITQFISKIPSGKIKDVTNFIQDIKKTGRINWTNDGVMIKDGHEINKSNIVDILNYYLKNAKTKIEKPLEYENIIRMIRPTTKQLIDLPGTSHTPTLTPVQTRTASKRSRTPLNFTNTSKHSNKKNKNQNGAGINWKAY